MCVVIECGARVVFIFYFSPTPVIVAGGLAKHFAIERTLFIYIYVLDYAGGCVTERDGPTVIYTE